MKIAVDAMGGDHAPQNPVAGALLAARELGVEVVLVGRREAIEEALQSYSDPPTVEIVHAEEVVGMDDSPATALRRKRDSSLHVAAELVREGKVAGLVSAGNTGAAMVISKMKIGTIAGVDRPALAVVLTTAAGHCVLLDVGANVDPRGHHLVQFGVMGHHFCREILGVERPRVGLLSIGEEAGKGTDLIREAHRGLAETDLQFLGNVESRDIFNGSADVVVSDGFTGNVVLKTSEAVVEAVIGLLREELSRTWLSRIGARLARGAFRRYRKRVDYAEFGGAPLLGLRGLTVICHGRSSPRAVKNGVRVAMEFREHRVNDFIEEALARLRPTETVGDGAGDAGG